MENYFKMVLCGITIYKKTDKTRANNKDAQKILDKYVEIKNINIKEIPEQIILNTLNTIKYQMELVSVRVEKNVIYYHSKNSGGTDYINGETFLI